MLRTVGRCRSMSFVWCLVSITGRSVVQAKHSVFPPLPNWNKHLHFNQVLIHQPRSINHNPRIVDLSLPEVFRSWTVCASAPLQQINCLVLALYCSNTKSKSCCQKTSWNQLISIIERCCCQSGTIWHFYFNCTVCKFNWCCCTKHQSPPTLKWHVTVL